MGGVCLHDLFSLSQVSARPQLPFHSPGSGQARALTLQVIMGPGSKPSAQAFEASYDIGAGASPQGAQMEHSSVSAVGR